MIVVSGDDNEELQSSNGQSMESFDQEKKETSGWTEHVWNTFIDRGFSDDVTETEEKVKGKQLISPF